MEHISRKKIKSDNEIYLCNKTNEESRATCDHDGNKSNSETAENGNTGNKSRDTQRTEQEIRGSHDRKTMEEEVP